MGRLIDCSRFGAPHESEDAFASAQDQCTRQQVDGSQHVFSACLESLKSHVLSLAMMRRRLTSGQLARRTGISDRHIRMWRNGERPIPDRHLDSLATAGIRIIERI